MQKENKDKALGPQSLLGHAPNSLKASHEAQPPKYPNSVTMGTNPFTHQPLENT
jgi:hypothetical protein